MNNRTAKFLKDEAYLDWYRMPREQKRGLSINALYRRRKREWHSLPHTERARRRDALGMNDED